MYSIVKTMESPCRTCENVELNKEECGKECEKLHAFQDAIIRSDERHIRSFGVRYRFVKN